MSIRGDAQALLGHNQHSFLSSIVNLKSILHPDDTGVAEILFTPSLEYKAGSVNLRLRHSNGRYLCVKGHYSKRLAGDDGKVLLDLTLEDARNIPEASDAHLLTSFANLIERTDDALYLKNRNHVILAASPTMPGYTCSDIDPAELIGKTDYDLYTQEIADLRYRMASQAFSESRGLREVRQFTEPDGTVHWLDHRAYPIWGVDGEISGVFGSTRELIGHIEIERKLRENEEALREAQEIAGLCTSTFDIPTKIWHVSKELGELLGIGGAKDLAYEDVLPLIHPDDRDEVVKRFKSNLQNMCAMQEYEHRFVHATDQTVHWVLVRSRIVMGTDQHPVALQSVIQDITERKRAEAAIRERDHLLQFFIEHAPAALAMLDREMKYIAVSRRWKALSGIEAESLVGRSHYEVLRTVKEEWKQMHQRVLQGETSPPTAIELELPDGRMRWFNRECRPWYTGDGQIGGMIMFCEDITEKRRAEKELHESRELLQLFIQQAPVALVMLDRDMRYLAVSSRWLEDENLKIEDVIGRHHYEVHPQIPESWREEHRRALAGETIPTKEIYAPRSDGSMRWMRREIRTWHTGDGSVGGIILFHENIMEQKRANAELRESKELLQLFIQQAPVALAMLDTEMRYIAASQRWTDNLRVEAREIIGRCHYDVMKTIPASWKEEHRRALAGETIRIEESHMSTSTGEGGWFRRMILPWRTGDGTIGGILIFAEDITKRKESEDRLRLAASVFTGAREGIVIADHEGRILDINDAGVRITGFPREEIVGNKPQMFKIGAPGEDFIGDIREKLCREGHWSGEVWAKRKNGDAYAESLVINAIRDAKGEVREYVALFTDITEMKEKEQRLEKVTHYDALTGLPNRTLFVDRLQQAMAQARRNQRLLAVVYFDVDGFKAVNDRHGRTTGDALLTAIAFRMRRALREGDTLARLGGDEFAAVLLDLDDANACMPILKRLLQSTSEEAQIGEVLLRVSTSAGVAYYPQSEEVDADLLLRQASQAMYQAKLAGRNSFSIFDPRQDLIVRGRHENLEHIRHALVERQFVLHYQPKVNMRTGKLVGAEALIRWQHPERGLLPPAMFLPVIENHPLAIDVGDWVIESALTQMETWLSEGFDIPVSVNVSAVELQQPDFAARLRQHLALHPRIKPSSLELEVVETSAMQDVVQASHLLAACREIGVSIGLDDFGTGYSSLTYLKRLPANVLKIDQSFVRDMLEEPDNLTILEGVLGLANAFHRQVIAEGVETAEHGLMLLQMGCEHAQGYGIAAPMSAQELRVWATSWRPDPRWADVPPVHAENRPILYACVEHRAWLGAFEAYVQGKRKAPPTLNPADCRLGVWLDGQMRSSRRMDPAIRALDALHRQFHTLAEDITKLQEEHGSEQNMARLRELQHLHDKCHKRLMPHARPGYGKSADDGA